MKKIKQLPQIFLTAIAIQFLFTSCANYYKAVNAPAANNSDKAKKLESLKSENRTFILRSGSQAFEMKEITVNTAENKIECIADTLSYLHKLHLTKGKRGKMRYEKNLEEHNSVLNEVHIYVAPAGNRASGKTSIALDDIQKIEVIEKDKRRTSNSYVLGGIGITAGVLIVAGVIIASSMSWDWGQ